MLIRLFDTALNVVMYNFYDNVMTLNLCHGFPVTHFKVLEMYKDKMKECSRYSKGVRVNL